MCSRARSLGGLAVLRDFDKQQITKRRSEDLRAEFARLMLLKWKTIVNYGTEIEVEEAKHKLQGLRRDTKRKAGGEGEHRKAKRQRVNGSDGS